MGTCKRRWGDRYDGRLIRSLPAFNRIVPFIMTERSDAQVFFEDSIDLGPIEDMLRSIRESGVSGISILHVMVASYVRIAAERPELNRFIAGQRIYARNKIEVSIAIKRGMTIKGEETTLKIHFEPTDTIFEVAEKLNKAINENKHVQAKNNTDAVANAFMKLPRVVISSLVAILKLMDYYGMLPKVIHRASPFHTSMFITDMGSLGIPPIYHHIYNFGTTPLFISFGAKRRTVELDSEGKPVKRKYLDIKVVGDERITDGFTYASAMRKFLRLVKDPYSLTRPPEKINEDIE